MEPFLGQIIAFGGNFAPRGWAFCDGQLLPINQNQALFSILGTTYGGDGRTTFALPDLRGRSIVHPGHGPGLTSIRLGEKSGRENVTLTINEMPNHNHSVTLHGETALADNAGAQGRMLSQTPNNPIYADPIAADNKTMAADSIGELSVGGGVGFNIRNPYVGINVIIALQGTFPSRS